VSKPDIQIALEPVIRFFSESNIAYYIGGSVASSSYGIARATLDVDIIAQLNSTHVPSMVKTLETIYYIEESSIYEALKRESSFNIIHLETMLKIDVFIVKKSEYDQLSLGRRVADTLDEEHSNDTYFIASCEDTIINKLLWYTTGEKVSERQWLDILGMIKVQQQNLDLPYLTLWTKKLKVHALFIEALEESGVHFNIDTAL
jgi:hypothetical protein